jgi:hypothetical protein
MVSSPATAVADGSFSETGSLGSPDDPVGLTSGDDEQIEMQSRGVATLDAVTGPDGEVVASTNEPVIPLSVATGITICAGFTVLFGVWPSPIINFAHAATLLLH